MREINIDGHIYIPYDEIRERTISVLWPKYLQLNGGNPYVSRKFGPLLKDTGFHEIQISASYHYFNTKESVKQISEVSAIRFEEPDFVEKVVEHSLADRPTLAQMAASFRLMGNHPDGFRANAYCEAVGWKR